MSVSAISNGQIVSLKSKTCWRYLLLSIFAVYRISQKHK